MISRISTLLVAVLFISLVTMATAHASSSSCGEVFSVNSSAIDKISDPAALATAQAIVALGAPELIASRLATTQPDLAKRLIRMADKKPIEWISIYRGFSGAIESHDPFYFPLNPLAGGHALVSPIVAMRPMPRGSFASPSYDVALAYATMGLYASAHANRGTVVEMMIPKAFVNSFLGSSYKYVPRSELPELDLWITRYEDVDVQNAMMAFGSKSEMSVEAVNWRSFEEFYFSEVRQSREPGVAARTINQTYRILNRIRAKLGI